MNRTIATSFTAVILAAFALFAGTKAGSAHAFIDHASPAVGSTVKSAPPELKLWFTEALEPAFSTAKVVDAAGKEVDKGDKHLDAQDKRLLELSLPALPPGTYKVIWHAVSVDTHTTNGDFTFTVAP